MELAGNIYRLRTARGMSQEELAAALGVSRQSVSKWETGAATPELDKVAALAALFGVTMDELVLGEARTAQETPAEGESEGAVNCFPPRRRYIAAVALLCTARRWRQCCFCWAPLIARDLHFAAVAVRHCVPEGAAACGFLVLRGGISAGALVYQMGDGRELWRPVLLGAI